MNFSMSEMEKAPVSTNKQIIQTLRKGGEERELGTEGGATGTSSMQLSHSLRGRKCCWPLDGEG